LPNSGFNPDLFVEEAIAYHRLLMRVGVPTELHVLPTAFHGSASIVCDASISVAYCQRLYEALKRFRWRALSLRSATQIAHQDFHDRF
jgi:hypothetical protein